MTRIRTIWNATTLRSGIPYPQEDSHSTLPSESSEQNVLYLTSITALQRPFPLAIFFAPMVTQISHALYSNSLFSHAWPFLLKTPFPNITALSPSVSAFKKPLPITRGYGKSQVSRLQDFIDGNSILPVVQTKNLDLPQFTTTSDLSALLCLYLQNISRIEQLLTTTSVSTLVKATIPSHLDDCSSI